MAVPPLASTAAAPVPDSPEADARRYMRRSLSQSGQLPPQPLAGGNRTEGDSCTTPEREDLDESQAASTTSPPARRDLEHPQWTKRPPRPLSLATLRHAPSLPTLHHATPAPTPPHPSRPASITGSANLRRVLPYINQSRHTSPSFRPSPGPSPSSRRRRPDTSEEQSSSHLAQWLAVFSPLAPSRIPPAIGGAPSAEADTVLLPLCASYDQQIQLLAQALDLAEDLAQRTHLLLSTPAANGPEQSSVHARVPPYSWPALMAAYQRPPPASATHPIALTVLYRLPAECRAPSPTPQTVPLAPLPDAPPCACCAFRHHPRPDKPSGTTTAPPPVPASPSDRRHRPSFSTALHLAPSDPLVRTSRWVAGHSVAGSGSDTPARAAPTELGAARRPSVAPTRTGYHAPPYDTKQSLVQSGWDAGQEGMSPRARAIATTISVGGIMNVPRTAHRPRGPVPPALGEDAVTADVPDSDEASGPMVKDDPDSAFSQRDLRAYLEARLYGQANVLSDDERASLEDTIPPSGTERRLSSHPSLYERAYLAEPAGYPPSHIAPGLGLGLSPAGVQQLRSNLYPLPAGWNEPEQRAPPSALDSVYEGHYGGSDVYGEDPSDDDSERDAVLPGHEPDRLWAHSPGRSMTRRSTFSRGSLRSPVASLGYRSQRSAGKSAPSAGPSLGSWRPPSVGPRIGSNRSFHSGASAGRSTGLPSAPSVTSYASHPSSARNATARSPFARSTSYGVASQVQSHVSFFSQHFSESLAPDTSPSPPLSSSPRSGTRLSLPHAVPTETGWSSWGQYESMARQRQEYGLGLEYLDLDDPVPVPASSVGPSVSASAPNSPPGPSFRLGRPLSLTLAPRGERDPLHPPPEGTTKGRSRGLTMSSYASGASTTKAPSDQTHHAVLV